MCFHFALNFLLLTVHFISGLRDKQTNIQLFTIACTVESSIEEPNFRNELKNMSVFVFWYEQYERHKNGHVTDAAPQSSHFHLKKISWKKFGKLIISLFWYFIINSNMLFNWIYEIHFFFGVTVCDCLYQSKHKLSEYNAQPQNMHHDLLLCATLSWIECASTILEFGCAYSDRVHIQFNCLSFVQPYKITKFLSYALFMR